MPWHFGRGIRYNKGDCPDCDGALSVDRIMGISQLFGHQVTAAWDYGAQGTTLDMTALGQRDPDNFPLDLSQRDDVTQWMLAITNVDDDITLRSKVNRGEVVFNYGAQLVIRRARHVDDGEPNLTVDITGTAAEGSEDQNESIAGLTLESDASLWMPSVWFMLAWNALTIEFEGTGTYGNIDRAGSTLLDDDQIGDRSLDVRQFGYVLNTELALYDDSFFLSLEFGGATGDEAAQPEGYLNYRWQDQQQPAGDQRITNFAFSPEYHVDQILFRRLLGTVTNAHYVKPSMTYWLALQDLRQVGINISAIYSIADKRMATIGENRQLGVELNGSLTYRNPRDGFYAGVQYGVLWPLSGLNRRIRVTTGDTLVQSQDAETAQSLRGFLGVRF